MSVLPLTPSVIQALRTDFRQGTWSATTQQFFQQLFIRVGGATAPTNADLAALIVTLQELIAALQADIDALEAHIAALEAHIAAQVPGVDRTVAVGEQRTILTTYSVVASRYFAIAGVLDLQGDAALEVL